MLQWGRVGEDAEVRRHAWRKSDGRCFNGAASVRTRKSAPGQRCSTGSGGFNGAASVRTRKSSSLGTLNQIADPLQWGRVGEDAEVGRDHDRWLAAGKLQWGRGGEDAEVREPGAVEVIEGRLQWGRVGEDAEV